MGYSAAPVRDCQGQSIRPRKHGPARRQNIHFRVDASLTSGQVIAHGLPAVGAVIRLQQPRLVVL